MEQSKIGLKIKEIRTKNNLTQQKLADMLNVTYQAVSKWETGKNIPDIATLQLISTKFDVDIRELLVGEKIDEPLKIYNPKIIYISIATMALLISFLFIVFNNRDVYEFRNLKSNNEQFEIKGVLAFSDKKSSIFISNIKANFLDDAQYQELECVLYEKNGNQQTKINKCRDTPNNPVCVGGTLSELLENITFKVDNFSRTCKSFEHNNLYLEINAIDQTNKTINYKIPLKLEEDCSIK